MMQRVCAPFAAAVMVGSAALLLAGCAKPTLKVDETVKTVADFVATNSPSKYRPTDVSCPSGLEAKVGTEFDCHFTAPDGAYTAHMKVTKVDGTNVLYDIQTRRT